MGGSDENNPVFGAIQSTNLHGRVKVNAVGNGTTAICTIAQTRRALSDINRNIVRPPPRPPNPVAVNKRSVSVSLSELNGCEKKQCVPIHRPITRKFAAQLLEKKHHVLPDHQETAQKASSKDTNRNVIDLDDLDEKNDFVQHTELIRSRTDQMIVEEIEIEIEMEDIDEEPITNIDGPDKDNPLAVVDYIDDLYAHYKKSEGSFCPSPNYMLRQADINDRMRSILVDWLIEVHYKFELMEETLYLTVNLIDRFLSLERVARKKLQLVGITAMLVACKYEEVTIPVVEDMILISDKAYTRKEVLEMEKSMVNKLQFNLSTPTPYVFLRRFLKAAISDKKLEFLASYIIELSLVEYEMLKFQPSLLAAAAVFTAQCSIVGSKQWSNTSKWYSTYSEDQLLECAKLMVNLHKKAPNSRLTGVYRKYSLSKYGYAVRSEPALFLLDDDQ